MKLRFFAYTLLSSMVAACGGGGGSSDHVNVIPAPPATVLPSAPPPQASPVYDSFTANTNKLVTLAGVLHSRTDEGGTVGTTQPSGATTFENSVLRIAFDASTGRYTLLDGPVFDQSYSQVFGPENSRADLKYNGPAYATYLVGDNTPDRHYLSVYLPQGDASHVPLTYTTVVNWVRATTTFPTPSTGKTEYKSLWAVGGIPTLTSDMPKSGTAMYIGFAEAVQTDGARRLGSSKLIANFGTGALDVLLTINGVSISTPSGPGSTAMTLNGTGSIITGTSRFSGTLSGNDYSGMFNGGFFGPAAKETGFVFTSAKPDGSRLDGVAAGPRVN